MEKIDIDQFKILYIKYAGEFRAFGYALETKGEELCLVDIKTGKKFNATLSRLGETFNLCAQIENLPYEAIASEESLKITHGIHREPTYYKELTKSADEEYNFIVRGWTNSEHENKTIGYECSLKGGDDKLEFGIDITDTENTLSSRKFAWDSAKKKIIYDRFLSHSKDSFFTKGVLSVHQWPRSLECGYSAEKYLLDKSFYKFPIKRKFLYQNAGSYNKGTINDVRYFITSSQEISELSNYVIGIIKNEFLGLGYTINGIFSPFCSSPEESSITNTREFVRQLMQETSIDGLKPIQDLLPQSMKSL